MNTKKFIAIIAAFVITFVTVSYAQPPNTPNAPKSAPKAPFAGVGFTLSMPATNGPVKIAQVRPDSPAVKAGIKPGSIIVSINGNPTVNFSLKHCVELIRGEPGTQVTIGLIDPDTKETHTFTLTRVVISVPPAKPANG